MSIISPFSEDKSRLSKIAQLVKTNFNDRADEVNCLYIDCIISDTKTLGRGDNGIKIPCPRCEIGTSKGEGIKIKDGLSVIKFVRLRIVFYLCMLFMVFIKLNDFAYFVGLASAKEIFPFIDFIGAT